MLSVALEHALRQELGDRLAPTASFRAEPVHGGSVNRSFRIINGEQSFFLKLNSADSFPRLFETERNSLTLIAAQDCLRTPQPIAAGTAGDEQYLLLEWIDTGLPSKSSWEQAGEQLAALHHCHWGQCGLMEHNYIGVLPQQNTPETDWVQFFAQHRLLPLLHTAIQRGLAPARYLDAFDKLITQLNRMYPAEPPSLLHGDLWSGNVLFAGNGVPVVVDPSCYYGHRSMDLAMTTLFGGFDRAFYEAYHYHYPLPSNYREQWDVATLYPLLVHLLLFGGSYLGKIESVLTTYR